MLAPLAPNPLDQVWPDQPEPPHARAVPHPIELAGETSESKRNRLAEELKKRGADAAVLTLPDSICWLLNIRGADVPHTPFALSFALLNADASVDLFIDPRKNSPELATHLGNQVRVRAPSEFAPALDALKGKTVLADPQWAAAFIFDRLERAGAEDRARYPIPASCPRRARTRRSSNGTRSAPMCATALRCRASSPGSRAKPLRAV